MNLVIMDLSEKERTVLKACCDLRGELPELAGRLNFEKDELELTLKRLAEMNLTYYDDGLWCSTDKGDKLFYGKGMMDHLSYRPVQQIKVGNMTVSNLMLKMRETSFGGRKLGEAAEVAEKMIRDPDCKVYVGFAGALVPGGMRQIIIDMLEKGWIDVFVSTGANLTHDIIEGLGVHHYQGHPNVDDYHLYKKGIDRVYDSFLHEKGYRELEELTAKVLPKIPKRDMGVKEFLWEYGKHMPENTILRVCADKRIPIFCPAIGDSGIGLATWMYIKDNRLPVLAFEDLKDIMDIAWDSKKIGVIYLGGGTPKNYIQQSIQISPRGAAYGIQITTDRAESGGSSGAPLREGVSWGKMDRFGNHVTLNCDVTIALPVIFATLNERMKDFTPQKEIKD